MNSYLFHDHEFKVIFLHEFMYTNMTFFIVMNSYMNSYYEFI